VAATPQLSSGALRAVASGWKFSPIFKVLSGEFMTVTTSQDRAPTSTPNQRGEVWGADRNRGRVVVLRY